FGLLRAAAVEACDALDGVRDSVIDDPRRCRFDPSTLLCAGPDGPACLTAPQISAARDIYAGPKNPRTGEQIFPGLEPGSEGAWAAMAAQPLGITETHFKYLVFKNPQWDYRTLNFDSDIALADRMDGGTINATDANLKPFVAHGGKLLLYHGWSDMLIAPR